MTQQLKSFISQVRARLEKSIPGPITFGKDEANNDALFWENPWYKNKEVFARLFWPSHPWPQEVDDQQIMDDRIGNWWEGFGKLCAHFRIDLPLALEALERAMETIDFYSSHETAVVSGSMGKILIDRGDKARICQKEVAEILERGKG